MPKNEQIQRIKFLTLSLEEIILRCGGVVKIQIKIGMSSWPAFFCFFDNKDMFNVYGMALYSSFQDIRYNNENCKRRFGKLWRIVSWL